MISTLLFISAAQVVRAPFSAGVFWAYERKLNFVNKAEEIDVEWLDSVECSISAVREDGFTFKTGTKRLKTRLEDQEVPAPKDLEPIEREFGLFKNGAYSFAPAEKDAFEERMSRVFRGLGPDPNENPNSPKNLWNREFPKTRDGVPEAAMVVNITRRTLDFIDVLFSYREMPGVGSTDFVGSARINVAGRIPLKVNLETKRMMFPGGSDYGMAGIEYKLVRSSLKFKLAPLPPEKNKPDTVEFSAAGTPIPPSVIGNGSGNGSGNGTGGTGSGGNGSGGGKPPKRNGG